MSGLVLVVTPFYKVDRITSKLQDAGIPVSCTSMKRSLVTVSSEDFGFYRYRFRVTSIAAAIPGDCMGVVMSPEAFSHFLVEFLHLIEFEIRFFGHEPCFDPGGLQVSPGRCPLMEDLDDLYYEKLLVIGYTNIVVTFLKKHVTGSLEISIALPPNDSEVNQHHFWCVHLASQIVQRHKETYGF